MVREDCYTVEEAIELGELDEVHIFAQQEIKKPKGRLSLAHT